MVTSLNCVIILTISWLSYACESLHQHVELRYDYIVVGAGSAGSALAARLATKSSSTILLIEEGGWSSQWDIIDDASKGFDVVGESQINGGYQTIPQTGAKNRIMGQTRGKITGGCGSAYFMDFVFAMIKDFDERWNISGWKWSDLSSYWDMIRYDWKISVNNPQDILFRDKILDSLSQNGYDYNPDYNDLNQYGQAGISEMQFAATTVSPTYAKRLNSWNIYIEPLLGKQHNLDILVYSRVNKVLLEQKNDKKDKNDKNVMHAIGVEVYGIGDKRIRTIYANKEVIICAGSLDTPKILLLSGIGDCNELRGNNIQCNKEVKGVGKNLQDDFQVILNSPPLKQNIADTINLPQNIFTYLNQQAMIIFDDNGDYEHIIFLRNVDPESFGMVVYTQHPVSRGEVTLLNSSPDSMPQINPNYFGEEYDKQQVVEAIRKGRGFFYGDAMLGLYKGESSKFEISPGDNVQSDDQVIEWAINNFYDGAHQVGTSKMGGSFYDEMVVVNNKLQVKGIDNLRIADCSIMPEIVSGHTNQIAVLIGLKGADIILQDLDNNG